MKRLILTFILLIGLYTLLRNNVFKLADEIVWITSLNLFYKVFIPTLMIISAIISFIKRDKIAVFCISLAVSTIDAINRLSVGINHLYGYLQYKDLPPLEPSPGTEIVVTNLWPSHIIFFIEVVLILYGLKALKRMKILYLQTSS